MRSNDFWIRRFCWIVEVSVCKDVSEIDFFSLTRGRILFSQEKGRRRVSQDKDELDLGQNAHAHLLSLSKDSSPSHVKRVTNVFECIFILGRSSDFFGGDRENHSFFPDTTHLLEGL